MSTTSIEWTSTTHADGTVTKGKTWNPVRGCSVISPGCHNCYAMKQAHRFSGPGKAYEGLTKLTERSGPQWTGEIATIDHALSKPLSWRTPARIFVNSMSDLFHHNVPTEFIDKVFAVMALCDDTRSSPKNHTFQVLTKRAERLRDYLNDPETPYRIHSEVVLRVVGSGYYPHKGGCDWHPITPWPLKNVWLGVSVESQKYADERIPLLLQTPAAVRFISAEPLLSAVNLRGHLLSHDRPGKCAACGNGHGFTRCPNYGSISTTYQYSRGGRVVCDQFRKAPGEGIDWVIVGGESGNGARAFDTTFARSIVKQCADAGVACFVKQLGAKPEQPTKGAWNSAHREPIVLADRKGGDMSEWPADLRVRQFPQVTA